MTCRDIAELLIDYVQGELDAERREHISQHLSLCPPCDAFVATYRITIQLSRRLPEQPMPPEMAERLRDMLQRHEHGGEA